MISHSGRVGAPKELDIPTDLILDDVGYGYGENGVLLEIRETIVDLLVGRLQNYWGVTGAEVT